MRYEWRVQSPDKLPSSELLLTSLQDMAPCKGGGLRDDLIRRAERPPHFPLRKG